MAELDARLEATKLRELYKVNPSQHSLKILVVGEKGSGKTRLLRTARRPIHVDSFDPGGTQVLDDLINRGDIVADVKYETEDPLKPWAFAEWRRNFEARANSKYFESFGTYCLDSCTTWSDAIMNWVLCQAKDKTGKPDSRAGEAPKWQADYTPQKVQITNYLKKMLALPCDLIVTGHINGVYEHRWNSISQEDEPVLTGYRFLSTGKGTVIIPLLFSDSNASFVLSLILFLSH